MHLYLIQWCAGFLTALALLQPCVAATLVPFRSVFSVGEHISVDVAAPEAAAGAWIGVFPWYSPIATTERVPAEFEPVQSVLISWTGLYARELTEIAAHAASVSDLIVVVPNAVRQAEALQLLREAGVSEERLHFIVAPIDSPWIRDYGPIPFIDDSYQLRLLDATYRHWQYRSNDDAVPRYIAQALGVGLSPLPWTMDGGNYSTDGVGTNFFSTRLYDWNSGALSITGDTYLIPPWNRAMDHYELDSLLSQHTGQAHEVALPYAVNPFDGTGHIDMVLKPLQPGLIALAESPPDSANHAILESMKLQLTGIAGPSGRSYDVLRLPAGYENNGLLYTYTNALITNHKVIVPTFGRNEDTFALERYRAALPGYEVVGVDMTRVIGAGGAVHCLTQTLPDINAIQRYAGAPGSDAPGGGYGVSWRRITPGVTETVMLGPLPEGSYRIVLFRDGGYRELAESGSVTVIADTNEVSIKTAVYDPANAELFLPLVLVDGATKFFDVKIRLLRYTSVQQLDEITSENPDYRSEERILILPRLIVDGVEYLNIEVSGLEFELLASSAAE